MRTKQSHKALRRIRSTGFTLVEMLVVAPIIIVVIGVFVASMIAVTGDVMSARDSNVTEYNLQDSLARIKQDVELSDGFLATNNIDITSPQGYDNASSGFHNANTDPSVGPILILNTKATNKNPYNSDRNIIYAKDQPFTCGSPQYTQNLPVMINVVYFVKNQYLWRRVLVPPNYNTVGCATPWQQPSCDPAISDAFCKTKDIKLVGGISNGNFTINYYPSPSSTSANSTAIDPSSSDDARQYALLATNTVEVTIKSETTSIGRTIVRTDTGRATSPNSSAKSLIITTQPSNVTKNVAQTATFTAASSRTGALVQWQQSTDKGITWSNLVNGGSVSGTTTASLSLSSVVDTMDGYLYRVVFTSGNDKVASNSARLTVNLDSWNDWTAFGTDWSNYDSTNNAKASYRRTTSGVVILKGQIKKSTAATAGETIVTLPSTYRPAKRLVFLVASPVGTLGQIDIESDGRVIYQSGDRTSLALDNIHFVPNNGRYASTPINIFKNGWSDFGGIYSNTSYTIDSIGRVHTQGWVVPGTNSNGILIFSLPNNLLPSEAMTVATTSSGFGAFYINSGAGGVRTKGLGTNLSMNTMYYPSGVGSWSPLALLNTCTTAAGGTSAQYTKAADGLVTIKGYITACTQNSTIATLPASYRPSKNLSFIAYNNNSYHLINISATGDITYVSTGTTTNLSLDNITFYGDQ